MKLKNQTILITGASQGLGVAMAEECAREGAQVVITARTLPEVEPVAARIRAAGGRAEPVAADMARPDELQALVKKALQVFGRIDGLINNAGINYVKPFLEIDPREWQRVLDVDLNGAFLLTQLCARAMHQAGHGGSIVQIASVHTHASLAGAAPYDAAKCGVVGFSKAAAVELAEIWKDILAAAPSEKECVDYWNANIPGRRCVTPLEVAKCCIFLLSDDSSCITGANIFADLGMTSLLVSREPYASKNINATEP
jgi:NAD(P)-dependent dehydrogenase (short-subunit alcohol dehydrogenase family)